MRRLDLSDCPSISGADIEAMAPCMPRLSHLALSRCFSSAHEADLAAQAVARLPCLTFLDLSQTQIGDSAVSALLESLALLRGLKIASCPLVTDEAFLSPSSSALNELDLSGNRNLGPAALRRLDSAANQPVLHSLSITGSLVDMEAVLGMHGGLGSLRSLKMGECECSPGGIVRLAHQALQLEQLDMSWCDHVSDDAVQVCLCPLCFRLGFSSPCVNKQKTNKQKNKQKKYYIPRYVSCPCLPSSIPVCVCVRVCVRACACVWCVCVCI